MTQHAAIPTTYRGVRFRSRLEARWACMFDQFGWKWEYEPLDLNGWIPDFLIKTNTVPVLVEVKPVIRFDRAIADKIEKACNGHILTRDSDEDAAFFEDYGALIVGATVPVAEDQEYNGETYFGWSPDTCGGGWIPATLCEPTLPGSTVWGLHCGLLGLWRDIITGEGGKRVLNPIAEEILRARWAMAGNATQWRAPR